MGRRRTGRKRTLESTPPRALQDPQNLSLAFCLHRAMQQHYDAMEVAWSRETVWNNAGAVPQQHRTIFFERVCVYVCINI